MPSGQQKCLVTLLALAALLGVCNSQALPSGKQKLSLFLKEGVPAGGREFMPQGKYLLALFALLGVLGVNLSSAIFLSPLQATSCHLLSDATIFKEVPFDTVKVMF